MLGHYIGRIQTPFEISPKNNPKMRPKLQHCLQEDVANQKPRLIIYAVGIHWVRSHAAGRRQSASRFHGWGNRDGRRVIMDRELEQRIRERAYDLWMHHGSLPGRADEYWYQAEQEVLGQEAPSIGPLSMVGSEDEAVVEVSAAPLGMTSETMDEVLTPPATKTRQRRNPTPVVSAQPGEAVAVSPKRRRTTPTA